MGQSGSDSDSQTDNGESEMGSSGFTLETGFETDFELYTGSANSDTLLIDGDEDNAVLAFAGDGNDTLNGGDGDDTFIGAIGDDSLRGNGDSDDLYGGAGNDFLFGGDDEDLLYGNGGNDSLRGGGDDDTLYGGEGNDTLIGNKGEDRITGGAGNDILIGGSDSDLLYGGEAADLFYLEDFEDTDYILDFELGLDKLGTSGGLNYQDLTITGDQNSLISYEDTTIALVLGVASSELTADNFQDQL